jgi:hypothetical protein
MQKPGQPRGRIGSDAGEVEIRGNPEISAPATLKDERVEATRNSIAGTAGSCREEETLQTQGKTERAMHGSSNLRVHRD